MKESERSRQTRRRALLLMAPAALGVRLAQAQGQIQTGRRPPRPGLPDDDDDNPRLPNGKRQRDEILKADYEKNLKESRELAELARQFADEMEKSDRFILSVSALKRLDEMEKLTRRIRGRMKGF